MSKINQRYRPTLIDKNTTNSTVKLIDGRENLLKPNHKAFSPAFSDFKKSTHTNANVALLKGCFRSLKLEDLNFTNYLPSEKISFVVDKKYNKILSFIKDPSSINEYNKSIDFDYKNVSRLEKILSKYLEKSLIDKHRHAFREADIRLDKNDRREDCRLFALYDFSDIGTDKEKMWLIVVFIDPYHLVFPDKNHSLQNDFLRRKQYNKSFRDYFFDKIGDMMLFNHQDLMN